MMEDEGVDFLAAVVVVLVVLVCLTGVGFADAAFGAALGAALGGLAGVAGAVLVALAFLGGAGLDSAGEI